MEPSLGHEANHGSTSRRSEPRTITYQPGKVELHKADVRWTRFTQGKDITTTEILYRKFCAILNKLTPQKFQSLAGQVLKLDITTEERLSGCINMIFTRAVDEEVYSVAYANLCKVMSPIKVDVIVEEEKKSTNFRRMLLTQCQREFEKDKQDDATLEEMRDKITKAESEKERQELKEELSLATTWMRKRSLGNIRFIGELFKLSMLSETIMHECITRLLKSTSDEESLECFGKLIMTTGKDLDRPEAKPRIDAYFRRIEEIIKKGRICARIKFVLKDVQDLKANNWVPRHRPWLPQLRTIDQIRAEARMEQERKKEMTHQHQVRQGGWRNRGEQGWQRGNIDTTKVAGILSKRKEMGAGMPSLGVRPAGGGWRKGRGHSDKGSPNFSPTQVAGHFPFWTNNRDVPAAHYVQTPDEEREREAVLHSTLSILPSDWT